MGGVYGFAIVGRLIAVVMTLGTRLDRRARDLKIRALMLFVTDGTSDTGFFVCFCVRGMKPFRTVTPDTRVFYRLVQGVTGSTGITVCRHGDRAILDL